MISVFLKCWECGWNESWFVWNCPVKAVIEIYVKKSDPLKNIVPEILKNIPAKIIETGEFIAY